MSEYVLTTDSTAELSLNYLEENNIGCLGLNCIINEKEYSFRDKMDMKKFYEEIKKGLKATTTQAKVSEIIDLFTGYAKQGINIIHIGFSGALSGSYNTECLIAKQVMEDYPNIKIEVIDSCCAAGGQGLLVRYAVKNKNKLNYHQMVDYITKLKDKIVHLFTVEDMVYLYRGGRVSKVKSVIANAMNIKPILHCTKEGKLEAFDKTRGRKKSFQAMIDIVGKKLCSDYKEKNDIFLIGHGNCLEEADYIGNQLKEKYGIDYETEFIGPTIGAHSGPGTIAIFFIGDER